MKVVTYLLSLFLIFCSYQAQAACSSPTGVNGEIRYFSGALRYCNNSSWIVTGTTVISSCSGTAAGTISYSGSNLRVCNGTNWLRTNSTTNHDACGTAGYFYYNTGSSNYWFCNGSNWRRLE